MKNNYHTSATTTSPPPPAASRPHQQLSNNNAGYDGRDDDDNDDIPVVFGTPVMTTTTTGGASALASASYYHGGGCDDDRHDGSVAATSVHSGGGNNNNNNSVGNGHRSSSGTTTIASIAAATATSAMYPAQLYNTEVVFVQEEQDDNDNNNVVDNHNVNITWDQNDVTIQALRLQGYTRGLIEAIVDHSRIYPLRFWIIDNSSSMSQKDGHRFMETTTTDRSCDDVQHPIISSSCSRWEEMQQTVLYHANLYSLLNCSTIFRLLNNPVKGHIPTTRDGRKYPQEFTIAQQQQQQSSQQQQRQQQRQQDLTIAHRTMTNVYPSGVTPLTHHIHLIRSNLSKMGTSLRQHGTKVSIIIATDGVPTNDHGSSDPYIKKQFIDSLRKLIVHDALPVSIVVRLCTDEANVVKYWNDLVTTSNNNNSNNNKTKRRSNTSTRTNHGSNNTNADSDGMMSNCIEVLDDFISEAKEIQKYNPWLNYALPIHRMREMGYYHEVFTALNKRPLNIEEFITVCSIIFGIAPMNGIVTNAHHPNDDDFDLFLSAIRSLLLKEEQQWNPITQRVAPWMDVDAIRICFHNDSPSSSATSSSSSPLSSLLRKFW